MPGAFDLHGVYCRIIEEFQGEWTCTSSLSTVAREVTLGLRPPLILRVGIEAARQSIEFTERTPAAAMLVIGQLRFQKFRRPSTLQTPGVNRLSL